MADHGNDLSFHCFWVEPEDVYRIWGEVKHLIEKALGWCDGTWDLVAVKEACEHDRALLWVAMRDNQVDSAGVTWITQYPLSKRLTLGFAGGTMAGVTALLPHVRDYARAMECDAMENHGRSGWSRILEDEGFTQTSTTCRAWIEE